MMVQAPGGRQHWQPLIDLANDEVESGRVPACQVAVAHRGEVVLFETFGQATNSTRFAAYSATKPIVASAVWQLMGEGRLDISKPVAQYIPEFASRGKEAVTLEQVLLHTAGFPQAPMRPEEGADPQRRRQRFKEWHLDWEPGSRFVYHPSSGHWVLADLLERVDGADFRDVIEKRVSVPLGLPRVLGIPEDQQQDIVPGVMLGSKPLPADDPARYLALPAAIAAGVPGGGAITTAADLARFYQALLHNPGRLWDPAILDDAKTHVRCTFDDPLMGVPVNRSIGLVLAGNDGKQILRYACFGAANSPMAFGHAGAHAQVAWADPATGISFAYLHNALYANMRRSGARAVTLSSKVAELAKELQV